MIDAKYRLLGEHLVQRAVERLRRRQVAAERFLDDHARVLGAAGFGKSLNDGPEHARRNGQIVNGAGRRAELLAQLP
jgi:hypothetical protein